MISCLISRTCFLLPRHFRTSVFSSQRRRLSCPETESGDQDNEDDYKPLSIENFRELITSQEDEKAISMILEEYELLKYVQHDMIPHDIKVKDMKELLEFHLHSESSRKRYLKFLRTKEEGIKDYEKIKRKKREEHEAMIAARKTYPTGTLFDEDNRPIYRKWHNAMFPQISDRTIARSTDHKNRVSAMFGQKIVIDLGFDLLLQPKYAKAIGSQMATLVASNTKNQETFDLCLSDFDPDSLAAKQILLSNTSLYEPYTMLTLDKRPFYDMDIPRQKIVYLTTFSRTPYKDVDEDDVIVMPGVYEKVFSDPLPLARAKKYGVRHACLPLDLHVAWKSVPKALVIMYTIEALSRYKTNGRDWRKAFMDSPIVSRIKTSDEIMQEELNRQKRSQFRRKDLFKIK